MPETVIIGAGLTGLSTAYHLRRPCVLLEKETSPGGICASVLVNGCTFDYSGHFLHLHQPQTKTLLDRLLTNKLAKIARKASIYTHGASLPYPFQANLYNLPEKIRLECLNGFLSKRPKAPLGVKSDFLSWANSVFGPGITKYFMKPYNEKLWAIPGGQLTAEWVAPFVPRPLRREIIDGANSAQKKDFGYNVSFYYPKRGGCQTIVNGFAQKVRNIEFNTSSERINLNKRWLVTNKGEKLYFGNLVSTQPLVELIESIVDAPSEVRSASKLLRWNSVECLNLSFPLQKRAEKPARGSHWVYFPENKYVFYRVGFYSNILPSMAPRGDYSMYVEISRSPDKAFDLKRALSDTLKGLRYSGLIEPGARPKTVCVLPIPYSYVIYDRHRSAALKVIFSYLKANRVFSIGRYGAWEYSFMESSIIAGKNTAARIGSL